MNKIQSKKNKHGGPIAALWKKNNKLQRDIKSYSQL